MDRRTILLGLGKTLLASSGILSGLINNLTALISDTTLRTVISAAVFLALLVAGFFFYFAANKIPSDSSKSTGGLVIIDTSSNRVFSREKSRKADSSKKTKKHINSKYTLAFLILFSVIAFVVIQVVFYFIRNKTSQSQNVSAGPAISSPTQDLSKNAFDEINDEVDNKNLKNEFPAIKLTFGTYYGESKTMSGSSVPDGIGVMFYSDGRIYCGSWKDGLKHGIGWHYWPESSSSDICFYKGDWYNGVRKGAGWCLYFNGDTYDGSWEKSQKSGYGIYSYNPNDPVFPRAIYSGSFQNDVRDGEGSFTGFYGNITLYDSLIYYGIYEGANRNDKFDGDGKIVFEIVENLEQKPPISGNNYYIGTFHSNYMWTGNLVLEGETVELFEGRPKN